MILVLIIAMIAGVVTFVSVYRSYYGDWITGFLGSILGMIIGGFLSSLIILLISCGVSVENNLDYNTTITEIKLVALKDNMSVEGGRYIYSGYIDEELKYTYLYEVSNKGITSGQIKADNCYINYINENETPKLVKTHSTLKEGFLDFITFDCIVDKIEYTLYIPSGSIVTEGEYKIDLE